MLHLMVQLSKLLMVSKHAVTSLTCVANKESNKPNEIQMHL